MKNARRHRRGFTLLELMVAMSITLGLGLGLVMLYNRCMDSFSKVEKSLRALQAFRTGADRLELELNSAVTKAQVFTRMNWTAYHFSNGRPQQRGNWNYMLNAIHGYCWVGAVTAKPCDFGSTSSCDGPPCWQTGSSHNAVLAQPPRVQRCLYGINFRPHYIGFYASLDGWRIDRVEYWFNPGEGQIEWNDGIDNDGDDNPDDALNPFHVRTDDRGSLVYRKKPDEQLNMDMQDSGTATQPAICSYNEIYNGPFNYVTATDIWPPADHSPPRNRDLTDRADVTAGMTDAELAATIPLYTSGNPDPDGGYIPQETLNSQRYYDDDAIVIGEGFSNIRFYYIYKTNDSPVLKRADYWPWDGNNNPFDTNNNPSGDGAQICDPGNGRGWQVRGSTDIWSTGAEDPPDPSLVDYVDPTYLSLPLAVEIVFTSNVPGMEDQSFTKLVFLYNSQWLRMLNPDNRY